jgi:hypothetical protein
MRAARLIGRRVYKAFNDVKSFLIPTLQNRGPAAVDYRRRAASAGRTRNDGRLSALIEPGIGAGLIPPDSGRNEHQVT